MTSKQTKTCVRCNEDLPASSFNKNHGHRDGLASWCQQCNAAYCSEWAVENRDRKQRRTLASHLKKTYGLSLENYELLLAGQNNRCAICAEICVHKARLSVDHCHDTGAVRGLLCNNCNNGLGRLKDSPGNLAASLVYLRASGKALTTEEMNDFLSALASPLDT